MDTFFDSVAGFLANQSCQLMVVFTIAALGTWMLKKQSAHWRYLLWLLVVGQCIVPAVVSLPVAILPADANVADLTPQSTSVHRRVQRQPYSQNHLPVVTPPAISVAPSIEREVVTAVSSPSTIDQPEHNTSITSWIVLGWIVISTVFLTVLFGEMFETQWRLRRLRVAADEEIQSQVDSIANNMSLWRLPKVYVIDASSQPFVFGWLRGDVYLPAEFDKLESAAQRNAILTHELAHFGRWDAAINLVQMFVQAIFFFHPAVWWANRKIREEREKCCDEFVLSDSKTSPKKYCEAIVQMLDLEREPSQFQSVLAVAGSTKNIEERMHTMLSATRKFRRRPSLAAIVILSGIAVIALPSAVIVTQAKVSASMPVELPTASAVDSTEQDPDVDWDEGQTMEFHVINADTKDPMPGVDLKLEHEGKGLELQKSKIQTTDTEGLSIIELPNLPPESMRVFASKPGFVPLRVYWAAEPTPSLPQSITISMKPGTTIGGTILDEDGNPVSGVKVSMRYWERNKKKSHGDSADISVFISNYNHSCKGMTTSDEDGRWQLNILPEQIDAAELRLFFRHPEFISDYSFRGLASKSIYETPSLEKLIGLSAVTTIKKGKAVEGVITNKDGGPLPSAKIFVLKRGYRADQPIAITGVDGEFNFSRQTGKEVGDHLLPGMLAEVEAFLIEAKGYAPELFEPKDAPISIQLKRGKTLRGRIVDESGKPLGKVAIWAGNYKPGKQSQVGVEAYTDANGRFKVEDLPAGAISYSISKRGWMRIGKFPMIADEKEHVVSMSKALIVKASVTDAETGELIKNVTCMVGDEYEDGRPPYWRHFRTTMVRTGRFEKAFDQIGSKDRIRVEADGYEPGISKVIEAKKDSDEHILTIEFKLKKGDSIVGTAIGVDGKPLAGAKVVLARWGMSTGNRHLEDHDGQNPITTTDEEGKFQFPPEVQPYCMVVIHEDGVGMITEKEMNPDTPIQIKPWDEKNKQMQIIRLPAEMEHSDFPKWDPFEERRKREKAKAKAPPIAAVPVKAGFN